MSVGRTRSYFSQDALPILDRVSKFKLPTTDKALTNLRLALADTSHLPIWNAAIYSLLEYKGEFYEQWYDTLSWKIERLTSLPSGTSPPSYLAMYKMNTPGGEWNRLRKHSTTKNILAVIYKRLARRTLGAVFCHPFTDTETYAVNIPASL